MPYGFKIEYTDPDTGTVTDITDLVGQFTIMAARDSYVRELTLSIEDPDFFDSLDFTSVPAAPALEVFTRTGSSWVSQGEYYIERPVHAHQIQSSRTNTLWGRSATAVLGQPFAAKTSVSVESDTTFFSLAEELVTAAGLTWDAGHSDIDDFRIYAYTYQRDNAYPIDILNELAGFAGASISTNAAGAVCVRAVEYSPAAADLTLTDDDIESLTISPEWPEFGNRIRITPAGSLSGFSLAVSVPEPCLPDDGISARTIYTRLTDADNEPVNNVVVSWSSDASAATLVAEDTNTAARLMPAETVQADNYTELSVSFPPATVVGVYAVSDRTRTNNLAAGGYSVSGTTITLTDNLKFCDQTVTVVYTSAGVAVNRLIAGSTAEDVTVTAEVEGATADGLLYIGNDCQCPPSLTLEAMPDSIEVNHYAALVVYGEEAGAPITTGRMIFLEILTNEGLGTISWGRARLGKVKIRYERASVRNDIAGISQADVSRFIAVVTGVWQTDDDGNPTGSNIYAASFGDKTVDLSESLVTGTEVVVTYTAIGAALCRYSAGGEPGRVTFRTWMYSNREAPVEATTALRINDDEDPYGDAGGDAEEDYGGDGGDDTDDDGLETADSYCTNDEGEMVQCEDDESCCDNGESIGCHPPEECDSALPDPCQPANLSTDPEANRFEEPMENGCTCEEACESEFSTYGTTQTYDDGSYRPVSELVSDEIGHDASTSEYNEKYAELKEEALQECIDQCDECGDVDEMAASDDNPETFDPPATFLVSFTGGLGPFTWKLSGVDGEMAAETTDDRDNSVTISDPDACGTATISINDSCGNSLSMGIRSTNGEWVEISYDGCPTTGEPTEGTADEGVLIKDGYKIEESRGWGGKSGQGGTCDWEPERMCPNVDGKPYTFCLRPEPDCTSSWREECSGYSGVYESYWGGKCCVLYYGTIEMDLCRGCGVRSYRTIYEWSCPTS